MLEIVAPFFKVIVHVVARAGRRQEYRLRRRRYFMSQFYGLFHGKADAANIFYAGLARFRFKALRRFAQEDECIDFFFDKLHKAVKRRHLVMTAGNENQMPARKCFQSPLDASVFVPFESL